MSFITKPPVKAIAKAFNMNSGRDEKFFDDLWELFQIGRKYKHDKESEIATDINNNYLQLAGAILNKKNFMLQMPAGLRSQNITITKSIFKRIKTMCLQPSFAKGIGSGRKDGSFIPADGPEKFVIFSDHHITENNHRQNHFGKNKALYMDLLNWYADNDYGLIENGDVEEYTIFEPSSTIVNSYNCLITKKSSSGTQNDVGSINWAALKRTRTQNRILILRRILRDNRDLYNLVDRRFASRGTRYYTRLSGNHDPYLADELTSLLPASISANLCDALRITYKDEQDKLVREPAYLVTHGHQFDTTTLPQHAFAMGELFSETLGWAIQGADRIWDTAITAQWTNSGLLPRFRNILATAESGAKFSNNLFNAMGEAVFEHLLHEHEIAWEYFDNKSQINAVLMEVMSGKAYYKVRHLAETTLVNKLDYYQANTELKNFRKPTKLIIGHTHEPRKDSKKAVDDPKLVNNYLNTGSAGRFENCIWGIELVGGTEKVVSWSKVNDTLTRYEWIPSNDGTLRRIYYPAL